MLLKGGWGGGREGNGTFAAFTYLEGKEQACVKCGRQLKEA